MATAAKKTWIAPEEYLARDHLSDFKSEYCDGQVYAMSGASRPHDFIAVNLLTQIHNQIGDRDCEVHTSDVRVAVDPNHHYAYPDISALCGEARMADGRFNTLLNPSLIVEVLSPSTEKWDRGGKAERYRQLESLRELVLISQDRVLVELYARREGGWHLTEYFGLDDILSLESIGCDVPLRAIYKKVELPDEPATADA